MNWTAQTVFAPPQDVEDADLRSAGALSGYLPTMALARSTNELWDAARSLTGELGCSGLCFVDMAREGGPVVVRTTFTPQFLLRELRQKLALCGSAIFMECGAVAFPVFGPRGLEGAFIITRDEQVQADWGEEPALSVALQLCYSRYRQLLPMEPSNEIALSDREREIMLWVMRGKSNAVIADILGISTSTVDTYMRRIFKKLKVADRTSAAMRAIAVGAIG
jgi:DNA-binding CsgD family transcriptional regulator